MVDVPTQETFDALTKQVQLLELRVQEVEKQVVDMKAAVQLIRDMIDARTRRFIQLKK